MKSGNSKIWQLSGFGKSREREEPKTSQVSEVGDPNDSSFLEEEILVLPHIENSVWDGNQDEWT